MNTSQDRVHAAAAIMRRLKNSAQDSDMLFSKSSVGSFSLAEKLHNFRCMCLNLNAYSKTLTHFSSVFSKDGRAECFHTLILAPRLCLRPIQVLTGQVIRSEPLCLTRSDMLLCRSIAVSTIMCQSVHEATHTGTEKEIKRSVAQWSAILLPVPFGGCSLCRSDWWACCEERNYRECQVLIACNFNAGSVTVKKQPFFIFLLDLYSRLTHILHELVWTLCFSAYLCGEKTLMIDLIRHTVSWIASCDIRLLSTSLTRWKRYTFADRLTPPCTLTRWWRSFNAEYFTSCTSLSPIYHNVAQWQNISSIINN